MAHLEELVTHPGVRELFTLAERQCVYGCCGLDAFDGDEALWDEQSRAAYAKIVKSGDAALLVVALDQVLDALDLDGYLDSGQLNGSIVADSAQGQEVISYLRRARETAAASGL